MIDSPKLSFHFFLHGFDFCFRVRANKKILNGFYSDGIFSIECFTACGWRELNQNDFEISIFGLSHTKYEIGSYK